MDDQERKPVSISIEKLSVDLEKSLLHEYGPILYGDTLKRALGFPSIESLRQAISRGTIGIPVVPLEHRRGKYALTKGVAHWLAQRRSKADRSR